MGYSKARRIRQLVELERQEEIAQTGSAVMEGKPHILGRQVST